MTTVSHGCIISHAFGLLVNYVKRDAALSLTVCLLHDLVHCNQCFRPNLGEINSLVIICANSCSIENACSACLRLGVDHVYMSVCLHPFRPKRSSTDSASRRRSSTPYRTSRSSGSRRCTSPIRRTRTLPTSRRTTVGE